MTGEEALPPLLSQRAGGQPVSNYKLPGNKTEYALAARLR
jgi:hypothetical protein